MKKGTIIALIAMLAMSMVILTACGGSLALAGYAAAVGAGACWGAESRSCIITVSNIVMQKNQALVLFVTNKNKSLIFL